MSWPLGFPAPLGGAWLQETHKGALLSSGPRASLMAPSEGSSGFEWILTVDGSSCVQQRHSLGATHFSRNKPRQEMWYAAMTVLSGWGVLVASPFPGGCSAWDDGRYSQMDSLVSACAGEAEAGQEFSKCLVCPRISGRLSKPAPHMPSKSIPPIGETKWMGTK